MNYGTAITMGKVLTGISKSLGIANQVIPLYQQTKPLFKNMKTAYSLFREFNNTTNKEVVTKSINNTLPKEIPHVETKKTVIPRNNSPQFFI